MYPRTVRLLRKIADMSRCIRQAPPPRPATALAAAVAGLVHVGIKVGYFRIWHVFSPSRTILMTKTFFLAKAFHRQSAQNLRDHGMTGDLAD
jgi:hypothetical protein